MIDYQTALRLKDAGFPQYEVTPSDVRIAMEYEEDEVVTYPSKEKLLNTLINKGQFHILEKIEDTYYCKKPNKFNDNDSNFILSEGSSAEMALANLYLYYNEKHETI